MSYLVVISPSGETVFSGVFGDKEGNNAGKGSMLVTKIAEEGNNEVEKRCNWTILQKRATDKYQTVVEK